MFSRRRGVDQAKLRQQTAYGVGNVGPRERVSGRCECKQGSARRLEAFVVGLQKSSRMIRHAKLSEICVFRLAIRVVQWAESPECHGGMHVLALRLVPAAGQVLVPGPRDPSPQMPTAPTDSSSRESVIRPLPILGGDYDISVDVR